jgi:NTE family protein
MRYALVLGGGGITGIAWETGLLLGLRELGADLTDTALIVGTSAGSVVGTQIATGCDLALLYERQLQPLDPAQAQLPAADLGPLMRAFADRPPMTGPLPQEYCAKIGQLALATPTGPEEERVTTIGARLPIHEWPDRPLLITTIDANDGRFVVWDKTAGIPLVLAVASSCAVPLIYPPTTIHGQRYIDGGIRSATNADLASSYDLVVIIAPTGGIAATSGVLDAEVVQLRATGSRVETIWPDDAARAAIGPNALDPAQRAAAAEAGRAQAATVAERVRAALAETGA